MMPAAPGFKPCLWRSPDRTTAQEQVWGREAVAFLPYVCQHIPGCVWLGRFPTFYCAKETSAKVVAGELLAMASGLL